MIWGGPFVLIAHPANERIGAPYSNHSEKVSTRHDSSLPTEHEPNSSMDWNHDEGQATIKIDAALLKRP